MKASIVVKTVREMAWLRRAIGRGIDPMMSCRFGIAVAPSRMKHGGGGRARLKQPTIGVGSVAAASIIEIPTCIKAAEGWHLKLLSADKREAGVRRRRNSRSWRRLWAACGRSRRYYVWPRRRSTPARKAITASRAWRSRMRGLFDNASKNRASRGWTRHITLSRRRICGIIDFAVAALSLQPACRRASSARAVLSSCRRRRLIGASVIILTAARFAAARASVCVAHL